MECDYNGNAVCGPSTGMSGGGIAGLIIGILVAVAVIGGVTWYCLKKNKEIAESHGAMKEALTHGDERASHEINNDDQHEE